MKKIYLFLLACVLTLLGSIDTSAQKRFRVDLNVDNMEWTLWNSNADKTLAWGRQIKTVTEPVIYISETSYASPGANNMAFWNKKDLQFYNATGIEAGAPHPKSYEINIPSGDYKIHEIGFDFICGKHPIARALSIPEYGVSVSINGEPAVENFSTVEGGEPSHVMATDINSTSVMMSVDFVANEALGSKTNCVFANSTNLYVIIEELSDYEKAQNAMNAAIDQYTTYATQMEEQAGTEAGQYSPELVKALLDAIDAANMLEDPSKPDPTLEQLVAARQAIIDAYEAALASKVGLSLENGYYRVRSSMEFHNNEPTGEVDENGADITETRYMYKYLRSYESSDLWYNAWQNRDETSPEREAMMLYKVENKEGGLIDMYNMGSETRFNTVPKSGYAMSTADSEQLIWLEPAKTEGGVTSVYICLSDQKSQPVAPNGMVALHQTGHSSGAGVSGWVIGWWANDGSPVEPTMWVFEPVSDEEAQAIMDAWAPVKEHKQLVKDYKAMYADAEDKLFKAKDYIKSDGLITSVDQLSSPSTEPSEGSLGELLDGNSTTYWHSNWSSNTAGVPTHTHYLQVELPNGQYDMMQMTLTRRPVANDHIILWGLMGSNNPEANDEDWTDLGQIATPFGSNTETISSNLFSTKGFKYLRFYIDETTKVNGVSRNYGHMSEFQLFAVTENPNSQFAQLGEIATTLDAVVEEQKGIEDEDINQAVYDKLKTAYDAFMAEVVDPTELRELIAELDGKEKSVVIGTNPGYWNTSNSANALKKALEEAKAYNEAGVYTRAQSAAHVEALKAASETLLAGAIGVQPGKWYRLRFATEEEYEANGWAKTGAVASTNDFDDVIDEALFGKYVTPAALETEEVERTSLNDDGEETTTKYTLKTVVPVDADEVALGDRIYVDERTDIASPDLWQFRFIAVADTAYMIQNKATGLFIQATGTTGNTRLSVHPTLFTVEAVGFGENVIAAKTFDGQKQNFLHVARSQNTLVTWNDSTAGTNSGLYIEYVGDVEAGYDGSEFNLRVVPGALNALCYPLELSATEGMYGISRIEGTEVTLAPIEKAEGGRPFIYIDGDPEDYSEDAEPTLVTMKHGFDITTEADTTSCLIGTFVSKTLKTGDVIVEGNTFAVLKDVMQGGVAAANSAYMTAEGTGFKRSDYPTVTIDMEGADGIAAAIANVAKTGALYTIDGQLVAKKANLNSLKNMPKGVYILNGTKVTVK